MFCSTSVREIRINDRSITRRRFGLAAAVAGMTGCGFDPYAPLLSLRPNSGEIRIVTPWGASLRDRFETAFRDWLKTESRQPLRIVWLPITDTELAAASEFQLLRSYDLILGGRTSDRPFIDSKSISRSLLAPARVPVIVPGKRLVAESPGSPASIETIGKNAAIGETGPNASFAWSQNPGDPLVRTFFLSVFEDAPDQSAGYARWVRLVGTSNDSASTVPLSLDLVDGKSVDRISGVLWNGGPGTYRTLGIPEDRPIYWPETMSWKPESASLDRVRTLIDFCRKSGWTAPDSSTEPEPFRPDMFLNAMASILRITCASPIREVWKSLGTATAEVRSETEAYLVSRPPWPPASILELRQERGFEFVVSLAEQLAMDTAQRDWLLAEFARPENQSDFRMLESADNGRLARSTRFSAWLISEWTAWMRQRCRRAARFLDSTPSSRSGLSITAPDGVPSNS